MYTTFAANSSRHHGRAASAGQTSAAKKHSKADGASFVSNSPISAASGITEARRPKRSQVARACESCRVNRIKCNDNQPCNACRDRRVECSNIGKPSLITIPTANKQVIQ